LRGNRTSTSAKSLTKDFGQEKKTKAHKYMKPYIHTFYYFLLSPPVAFGFGWLVLPSYPHA
ncbi:hypothetical protein, partial [Mammaliicoccus sciuri]|uniref:hypothetical protein n=1 Tax=Mammaliicoccus sciuri TaxID=1296 RepID=UPI001F0D6193